MVAGAARGTVWDRVGPHETTWDHAGPHGTPGTDPFRIISTYGKFICTYGNFQRLVGPRGTSGTARVHPPPPASIRNGRVQSSPHIMYVMIEPRTLNVQNTNPLNVFSERSEQRTTTVLVPSQRINNMVIW